MNPSTSFEFATTGRILFGPGTVRQAGRIAAGFGPEGLLVVGQNSRRAEAVRASFREAGLNWEEFSVCSEPTVGIAFEGAALARVRKVTWVVACGGGSVLDAGKAVAALATNPGDPFDFLEIIGRGLPLIHAPLPLIAIPTTAGTGAEATRNAVLGSPDHRAKVSLRSPKMLPPVALVDPELALGLPAGWTASTGLDALTQLLEPLVGNRANPLSDALCREGLPRVARALPKAVRTPESLEHRSEMALGALLGGMALANSGLGAVHGLAGPIGGLFPVPHGMVCAALLPAVWNANLRTLQSQTPRPVGLTRYEEAARLLTGQASATLEDGYHWLSTTVEALGIPRLRDLGISRSDFPEILLRAASSSSMKGNPVLLSGEDLLGILDLSW